MGTNSASLTGGVQFERKSITFGDSGLLQQADSGFDNREVILRFRHHGPDGRQVSVHLPGGGGVHGAFSEKHTCGDVYAVRTLHL